MSNREEKKLLQVLGFKPKENTSGIFYKKYKNYAIEIDFENKQFNFGTKIKAGRETTQNFSQPENWVILECVDRLLEKGYKPQNIILEKKYTVGHGASGGWLDILVTRNDGSAYLMIECKTWGKEFEKSLKKTEKDGGQLMTYFQQDKSADILMLYASKLDKNKVLFKNQIIKIEEHYRQAGNVEDVFDRWNKITNTNGIFDDWVKPYLFENKKILKKDLIDLNEEASKSLFNKFLSILRKHSVSDKPNAFNVIFDLFLAKLWDEKKEEDASLDFQWKEKEDDPVIFQYRLLDLYRAGMDDFLKKEVFGLKDSDFNANNEEELKSIKKKVLMLEKVFNIKSVIDEESFEENHKVLKEVVQLLQGYKIRYPRKQQHLSDFFERLLTTGLKQEAGQFFTPSPITRFIIKSLPIKQMLIEFINQQSPKLPAVIDYAVGSGHFLTEVMEEYQSIINKLDISNFKTDAKKHVQKWRIDEYDWAGQYIYGVDKDHRLVKVAKVGCYFYGDGLAQVIHGDGLDNFDNSKSFRGLLKDNATKPQFQLVLSNPPYSVSAFKTTLNSAYANKDFKLFDSLTDRSSEIECLFVERTKQLLKTNGIAVIILPSSILSNSGIYAQAREIILKAFDIIAITELGSATFMATGTNTVTLFLRRRDDTIAKQIEQSLTLFFTNHKDITINGIENPIEKYLSHVWEDISFTDYKTLLQKKPNEAIKQHEIFREYDKKVKAKNKEDKWTKILDIEKEKLLYFILTYNQKVVLVKTGSKAKQKQFLGYEFSNRRGSEGMHPIQRGKSVDECTQLYDVNSFENENKASTYIYKAFAENKFDLEIPKTLKENISYQNLADMLTFDRVDFEKDISLSVKKKVRYEELWNTKNLFLLSEITEIKKGKTITESKTVRGDIPVVAGGKQPAYFHNESNRNGNVITVSASGAYSGFVDYFSEPIFASDCNTIISLDEKRISTKLIYYFLKSMQNVIYGLQRGQAQPHVYAEDLSKIKIPLPPLDIQQKIVDEIEVLERQEERAVGEIEALKVSIKDIFQNISKNKVLITEICEDIFAGGDKPKSFSKTKTNDLIFPVYANGLENKGLVGYTNKYRVEKPSVTLSARGTIGFPIARNERFTPIVRLIVIIPKKEINVKYIEGTLKNIEINSSGSTIPQLTVPMVKKMRIPLPKIEIQEKIVLKIEKLEKNITELENKIAKIPKQKEAILKKYL